jgi:hypothetical protein
MMRTVTLAGLLVAASCAPARYPSREPGCPVRMFAGGPSMPVDELGPVTLDCTRGGKSCERHLLDAVCQMGGDVAWGTGDSPIGATHLTAHAAHSLRATHGARERGCAVQVFTDALPVRTENIGPVKALCDRDDSRETCLRELEDQVCLLGGDVLWQVDGPAPDADKQKMLGRAAHTRASRATP